MDISSISNDLFSSFKPGFVDTWFSAYNHSIKALCSHRIDRVRNYSYGDRWLQTITLPILLQFLSRTCELTASSEEFTTALVHPISNSTTSHTQLSHTEFVITRFQILRVEYDRSI
jgi:hypothetical protein